MKSFSYFDSLLENDEFRFHRLELKNIDNDSVIQACGSEMQEQETCLFHRDISDGDEYVKVLHDLIYDGMYAGKATPIVRFADGEYAFYAYSLNCNGLYQQAESIEAIRRVMPIHVEALRKLNESGKFAPLIYPGNVRHKRKTLLSFLRRSKDDDSALRFIEFLFQENVKLTKNNYLPFYSVYSYLTSSRFCEIVDDKTLCIISSECNMEICLEWFGRFSSHPKIVFVEIPDSYVATQWESIKVDVLETIPSDVDLCLVGAGVGALLVCVDVAREFAIPTIDAGHVLNMMNSREDKSLGPRLYTIHKKSIS